MLNRDFNTIIKEVAKKNNIPTIDVDRMVRGCYRVVAGLIRKSKVGVRLPFFGSFSFSTERRAALKRRNSKRFAIDLLKMQIQILKIQNDGY